jgi:hypothetical protein
MDILYKISFYVFPRIWGVNFGSFRKCLLGRRIKYFGGVVAKGERHLVSACVSDSRDN